MALEQAQQQFAAAGMIGYESRALNLFYGLSQAGRALAAGSRRLGRGTGQRWQSKAHGLRFDETVPEGLTATPIDLTGGTSDLFSRVSIAIDSPWDFGSIDFGAATNQLLDYTMMFREPERYPRPIPDAHVYANSSTFPLFLEVRVPHPGRGSEMTVAEVRESLSIYPALRHLAVAENEDGTVRWGPNEGQCIVVIEDPGALVSRGDSRDVRELKGYTTYRGSAVLMPRVGNSDETLRPLMAWWVVLYALSTLARYAPVKWTQVLSIAESPLASRIEFLLDAAVDAVPELLSGELLALQELQPGV